MEKIYRSLLTDEIFGMGLPISAHPTYKINTPLTFLQGGIMTNSTNSKPFIESSDSTLFPEQNKNSDAGHYMNTKWFKIVIVSILAGAIACMLYKKYQENKLLTLNDQETEP